MARQAWQICRGTRRLNVGAGAVLWHRPGCPGTGIMTELIFASGQRPECGRHAPGPTAPMARDRPRSHLPEKMPPPRLISPVSGLSATLPH